jgi:hypothetical protein
MQNCDVFTQRLFHAYMDNMRNETIHILGIRGMKLTAQKNIGATRVRKT